MSPTDPTGAQARFSDDQLIAFLDGATDAATRSRIHAVLASDTGLATRLAELRVDTGAMAKAFAPMLATAPTMDWAELQRQALRQAGTRASLDPADKPNSSLPQAAASTPSLGTTFGTTQGGKQSPTHPPRWPAQSWAAAACVMAAMLLSVVAVRWHDPAPVVAASSTPSSTDKAPTKPSWRMAVVEYQRLYVRETLAGSGKPDAETTAQQLASVSSHSGLTVKAPVTELPGLSFRRAQSLGINDQPLIQMAYVTADGEPVALCFTRQATPAMAPTEAKMVAGINTVSWNDGQFGFVLVGRVESAVLLEAARVAARQLGRAG